MKVIKFTCHRLQLLIKFNVRKLPSYCRFSAKWTRLVVHRRRLFGSAPNPGQECCCTRLPARLWSMHWFNFLCCYFPSRTKVSRKLKCRTFSETRNLAKAFHGDGSDIQLILDVLGVSVTLCTLLLQGTCLHAFETWAAEPWVLLETEIEVHFECKYEAITQSQNELTELTPRIDWQDLRACLTQFCFPLDPPSGLSKWSRPCAPIADSTTAHVAPIGQIKWCFVFTLEIRAVQRQQVFSCTV